jgi:DNA-binding winged helix-turn-helix (wHTH) protein
MAWNSIDGIADTNTNTVTRSNETLSLSPRTFQLLVALARHAPNVVSRKELLETIWRLNSAIGSEITPSR